MNYYEHHLGDYAAATSHLSLIEDAVYSRMLRRYYLQEGPLPADAAQVARLCGARTDEEVAAVDAVLAEFFRLEADGWHQSRCDEEIARYLDKRTKAKASANASVSARRQRADLTNTELRSLRMKEARRKGTHTKTEWLALVEFCEGKCVRCGAEGHLDRDHIVPVYQGGSDSIDNIQPLCAQCNASKGSDSADHRPSGWQATVQRSLNGRSTHQTPDTNHQKEQKPEHLHEPALPVHAEALIPLVDGSEFPITASHVDEFSRAYPAVDVLAELRKIRAWCISNPRKRKTKAGVMRSVNTWLSKAQDEGPKARAGPSQNGHGKTMSAIIQLEEMKNGLANSGNRDRDSTLALPQSGRTAGR